MSPEHHTTVWASEADYDALEACLSAAGVRYERSQLTQFSTDPTPYATLITISLALISPLAAVLSVYLRERKRRIVIAKPDGTRMAAENYSPKEVERLLGACAEDSSADIYIESRPDDDAKT